MKVSAKRALICAAFIILAAAVICGAVYLKSVSDYQRAVSAISFEKTIISDIADGVYTGECDVDFIRAKVKITVSSGTITDIDILEHKNGRGKPAEAIAAKIVDEQKIDVDAVSGATNSSVVIKKTVENALKTAR